jgi:nucleotide-binding universal stress UspA family protein
MAKKQPRIIVSYDDTDNDRDALALGRLLSVAGADLSLAYVRHVEPPNEPDRADERDAEALLERGAKKLGAPDIERHVVYNASTGQGLIELAKREKADLVVFGSDYRTARGHVMPGTSAQRMLNGGPVAIAVAPAGLRSRSSVRISRIGFVGGEGDDAPDKTARSLASALDASVTEPGEGPVDLLVVGSRKGSRKGTVELSGTAGYAVEVAKSPVLAVPRATAVQFAAVSRARS